MTEPGTLPEGIERLEKEVARLREQNEWLHRERIGEVWCWQGDSEDHLESLACPILISPERLRAAIAEGAAQERARARAELDQARELLSPNCTEETLLGAIRNLQQAHLSEKGNAEDAEKKFQQAEESRRTNARLLDRALAELRAARSAWTAHEATRTPPPPETAKE